MARIKNKTPEFNVNVRKLRQIRQKAKSKVSYAYKEKFNGVYDDIKK